MATRFRLNFEAILDTSVEALAGGTLTFYQSGTTTLKTIYSDNALTVPKTNPVVLDSAGQHGDIFLQPTSYRVLVKDANGATIPGGDIDPLSGAGAGVGIGQVSSIDTIPDLRDVGVTVSDDGAIAYVKGYYAAGDCEGRNFRFDAASTVDDDNGMTIKPASIEDADPGRWVYDYDGTREIPRAWFGEVAGGIDRTVNSVPWAGANTWAQRQDHDVKFKLKAGRIIQPNVIGGGTDQRPLSGIRRVVLRGAGKYNFVTGKGTIIDRHNGTGNGILFGSFAGYLDGYNNSARIDAVAASATQIQFKRTWESDNFSLYDHIVVECGDPQGYSSVPNNPRKFFYTQLVEDLGSGAWTIDPPADEDIEETYPDVTQAVVTADCASGNLTVTAKTSGLINIWDGDQNLFDATTGVDLATQITGYTGGGTAGQAGIYTVGDNTLTFSGRSLLLKLSRDTGGPATARKMTPNGALMPPGQWAQDVTIEDFSIDASAFANDGSSYIQSWCYSITQRRLDFLNSPIIPSVNKFFTQEDCNDASAQMQGDKLVEHCTYRRTRHRNPIFASSSIKNLTLEDYRCDNAMAGGGRFTTITGNSYIKSWNPVVQFGNIEKLFVGRKCRIDEMSLVSFMRMDVTDAKFVELGDGRIKWNSNNQPFNHGCVGGAVYLTDASDRFLRLHSPIYGMDVVSADQGIIFKTGLPDGVASVSNAKYLYFNQCANVTVEPGASGHPIIVNLSRAPAGTPFFGYYEYEGDGRDFADWGLVGVHGMPESIRIDVRRISDTGNGGPSYYGPRPFFCKDDYSLEQWFYPGPGGPLIDVTTAGVREITAAEMTGEQTNDTFTSFFGGPPSLGTRSLYDFGHLYLDGSKNSLSVSGVDPNALPWINVRVKIRPWAF